MIFSNLFKRFFSIKTICGLRVIISKERLNSNVKLVKKLQLTRQTKWFSLIIYKLIRAICNIFDIPRVSLGKFTFSRVSDCKLVGT